MLIQSSSPFTPRRLPPPQDPLAFPGVRVAPEDSFLPAVGRGLGIAGLSISGAMLGCYAGNGVGWKPGLAGMASGALAGAAVGSLVGRWIGGNRPDSPALAYTALGGALGLMTGSYVGFELAHPALGMAMTLVGACAGAAILGPQPTERISGR